MDFLALIFCLYLLWGLFQALSLIAKRGKRSPSNLPPGPRPLPVIGNLLELGNLPHKSLAKLARTYGPIIKLQLGSVTTVVISSPTLAREILQSHDAVFANRTIPDTITAHDHHQLGLPWMPVSPLFRNLRKIYNSHLLSSKKLDSNRHLRSKKVQELVAYVGKCAHNGDVVDIGEAAFRTTLNSLSNTVFSLDMTDPSTSAKELKEVMWQIMAEVGKPNIADYFPVLKKIDPQGSKQRTELHFSKMLDIFDGLIKQRLQLRTQPGATTSNDVLDALLDVVEDKSEDLDISLVKHLFLDFFVAGSETTSSTLEWAMGELLRNPEKLSRAQTELHLLIGKGKQMKEADISRLPYLQATVKETLRMHPPIPLLLPRKAEADAQIGGFTIPKGAQVLLNAWAIGRDPAIWASPNEFMPERFLGSDIDLRGQNFELIPFGGGRRICPGLPLAMRMLHLMLGSLINAFNWRLEDGVAPGKMNMEDKFGITVQRAQPVKAVAVPV
ncbi:geraniol 8-hydroxylase-like [Syzygium oleosum]|uniref:geraniol 8-hydroxylase-like n=1 Tax=Syzygium oleosum TaxID=219896 RepID=UPI0011D27970|nr:geraniol 8-hydroxylase-like [Syzygium oleosum]XP_056174170.1 geraniol 8-hydroxylase-like [Syzygium oleosum]